MDGIKIIISGDLTRLQKVKRFTCDYCGCVWEASATRYRDVSTQWDGTSFECCCPTCGKYCYTEE